MRFLVGDPSLMHGKCPLLRLYTSKSGWHNSQVAETLVFFVFPQTPHKRKTCLLYAIEDRTFERAGFGALRFTQISQEPPGPSDAECAKLGGMGCDRGLGFLWWASVSGRWSSGF